MYCTTDSRQKVLVERPQQKEKMSPRNLLITTITDELRMATNFQSKVVAVSLKDGLNRFRSHSSQWLL
jgi:hypothetical protein